MGGRKRNKNKAKGGQATPTFPDEVADTLVLLLDTCGIFSDPDVELVDFPRRQLITSLDRLSLAFTPESMSALEQQTKLNESTLNVLLRLEEISGDVHTKVQVFSEGLDDRVAEALAVLQDLETFHSEGDRAHFNQINSWIHICRSIVCSFQRKAATEQKLLNELHVALDMLYRDDCNIMSQLRFVTECIDQARRCLSHDILQPTHHYIAILLQEMLQGGSSVKSLAPLPFSATPAIQMTPTVNKVGSLSESIEKLLAIPLHLQGHMRQPRPTRILIVGDAGSGKTHLCSQIEQSIPAGTRVIYPRLSVDLLGSTVGKTEDTLYALFMSFLGFEGPAVLLLDDVDHVLIADIGSGLTNRPTTSHVSVRVQSIFLAMMDRIQNHARDSNVEKFVVCTAKTDVDDKLARFDHTYYLDAPKDLEREKFVSSAFDVREDDEDTRNLLSDIVEASIGRSYSELEQYCRDAIASTQQFEATEDTITPLRILKQRLQLSTPESLRNGSIDSFVDIRVTSARDLQSAAFSGDDGRYRFPLLGKAAATAWKLLQSNIIVPLCYSRSLAELQSKSTGGLPRSIVGGVLLCGPPGCGKTEISYHCARYATSLSMSVKLLDVTCTSLIHKELGSSEKAVHQVFDAARKAAPCILLLDGLENIAAVRGNDSTTEGTLDRVLSTMLVELDGVEENVTGLQGVAVIGTTRNPDWIDPAIKRPGRLQKVISLDLDW